MVRPSPGSSILSACTCALGKPASFGRLPRPALATRPPLSSTFSTSLPVRKIDLADLECFAPEPEQTKSTKSTLPQSRPPRSKPLRLSPAERAAEADRREQLHKARLATRGGLSPEKQYALKRERERVYSSNLEKRHPKEAERLLRSAKAVGAGAVLRQAGDRGQRGGVDRRGGDGRSGGAGAGGMAKPMVAGMVNSGTRTQGPRRDQVKPVVRGGAPRNVGSGGGGGPGQRRRQQKKPLKKVTLPSTIRLENLTNLLGVKLCEFVILPGLSNYSGQD